MRKPNIALNAALNALRYILKVVLPIISFHYVTTALGPNNYGMVTYCSSIISYFALLAGLGVNEYGVREGAGLRDEPEKINRFVGEVFTIEMCATVTSYVLLGVLLLMWHENADYKLITAILSMNLILTTIGVEWIYTIYEDFAYITIRSFAAQVLSILLIFLLIRDSEDYLIYAAITVGASGLANFINFIHVRKYVRVRLVRQPNFKAHLKPIIILFSNVALISVYLNSDKTLLGIMLGNEAVGVYEVSVKIYTMVKGILNAVVLVVLPRLSAYLREESREKYGMLANKIFNAELMIMFPAIVGLFMVSRNVVLLMSGPEYAGAVGSLRILSIALMFAVAANFFVYVIMMSHRMDKYILIATIISAALNVTLNFIAIPLWGINGAALTTLLAELTVAAIGVYYCRDKVKLSVDGRLAAGILLGCAGIAIVCLLTDRLALSLTADTMVKVVASVAVYGGAQFVLNRKLLFQLIRRGD